MAFFQVLLYQSSCLHWRDCDERCQAFGETYIITFQFSLIVFLVCQYETFVLFEGVMTSENFINKKTIIKRFFSKRETTHFLEKSLKHNRSLFWCLVGIVVPSEMFWRKVSAISKGPWLTCVPIQPWRTIWRILGSAGSWLMAAASSNVFFWMSSIATSIGSRMIDSRATTWIRVLT